MHTDVLGVSATAQSALVKLLVKLGCLGSDCITTEHVFNEQCPIAHFAKLKLLDETIAIEAVANHFEVPVYTVTRSSAESFLQLLEHENIRKVPLSKWRSLRAMPVAFDGHQITVAFANPLDNDARRQIEFELGIITNPAISPEKDILQILTKQLSESSGLELQEILEDQSQNSGTHNNECTVATDDFESPPVVRLVNKIISDAAGRGASDIHIEAERQDLLVRIRVDGIMQPLFSVPKEFQSPTISRIKILAGMDITEKRKPQDGRVRVKTPHGTKDLRIASAPSVHGENLVIRILTSDLNAVELSSLGMPEEVRQSYRRALSSSSRVILVTGPTGSGKTSTLYAGLIELRNGARKLITIEDPIEYRIDGVNQIQVNHKIGLSFAEGLRSIVRQDPDVVMVGEIRDEETAAIAMQVAQTGHLVLSSIHTNTAASAITRLRDLKIPAYLVASSLGAIIAQRLVRRVCSHCSKALSPSTIEKFKSLGLDPTTARSAGSCDECNHSGYHGRIGVYSFLEITDETRHLIREERGEDEIENSAKLHGFLTLQDSALNLAVTGLTTLEEVERVLGPVSVSTSGAHQPNYKLTDSDHSLAKRKVLLVEDDENTRAILTMLLQNEMYHVIEAANGYDGLEKVFKEGPELIICDYMMPKMNGLQLVQKIRSDSRTRHIPVLMLTAVVSEENEANLITSGADDFVDKGSDTRVLLARVQRLLQRSEQQN